MFKFYRLGCVAMGAALAAACGGQSSTTGTAAPSTSHGTLAESPPFRIASLSAAGLTAQLNSTATTAALLQITGNPACGVDFYYIKFWTLGGANEVTQSSGALMVPTGAAPACSGPRPVVLYAHGTQANKTVNIADPTSPLNVEGVVIAATFAAQGYIVVAPNYAGYDISTLGYHPFLNAVQQSGEMMDMLAASRAALPTTLASATSDSGKLFISGYSEGGHVAMATERAMLLAGAKVTAAAPLSGPYALEAFGDALFFGSVNIGSTEFTPLLTTSYQKAYGNIYTATTDFYSTTFAAGIDSLLPSSTPIATIYGTGLLPLTATFNSTTPVVTVPGNAALSQVLTQALAEPSNPANPLTPLFDAGFGNPYLINNSYRVAYALDAAGNPDGALPTPTAGVPLAAAAPTQPLRLAFYKNDLRNGHWIPSVPTLMCGGDKDPTVFFSVNTGTMQAFWAGVPTVAVLDVNAPPAGPFAAIQGGFQTVQAQTLAQYESAAGGGLSPAAAQLQLIEGYHTAVVPWCVAAARAFFSQF